MSTASITDSSVSTEITYPIPTKTLRYDDVPWTEIEALEHLILECFHNGLGQMGTIDLPNGGNQWVFYFTAQDLAAVSYWPKEIVNNPILKNSDKLWVFCTFTEDDYEEEWYDQTC